MYSTFEGAGAEIPSLKGCRLRCCARIQEAESVFDEYLNENHDDGNQE